MSKEDEFFEKLSDLMDREIGLCGDCEKIPECWALENLSLGKPGHINHYRPAFEKDFICRREPTVSIQIGTA